MKGSTHNHTLFCFRVVPISKTRNAHNIELFIYFPILNVDEKIPSFMEQIFLVNDEEIDRIQTFGTISREITTSIIVIVFVAVLCIIIFDYMESNLLSKNKANHNGAETVESTESKSLMNTNFDPPCKLMSV